MEELDLQNELNSDEIIEDNNEVVDQSTESPIDKENQLPADNHDTRKFYELSDEEKKQIYDDLPTEGAKKCWRAGWKPKEFFGGKNRNGSPREFVDWPEYLANLENITPIRNERLNTSLKEKNALEEEVKALKTSVAKFMSYQTQQSKISLGSQENLINKEIAEAREYGDIDRYEKAMQAKLEIDHAKLMAKDLEEPIELPKSPKSPTPKELLPEQKEFLVRNSDWWHKDMALTNYALGRADQLDKEKPYLTVGEQIAEIENELKTRFPEKFPNAKRITIANTRLSGINPPKPKEKGLETLSTNEKLQLKQLISLGIFKDEADFLKHSNY